MLLMTAFSSGLGAYVTASFTENASLLLLLLSMYSAFPTGFRACERMCRALRTTDTDGMEGTR